MDRILTVASDLLLRWGYNRVTVEEIANRAEIGKGTVYLHWDTKDDLFLTLVRRDTARLVRELAGLIEEYPSEVLPHRLARSVFVYVTRHPLLEAFLGGNRDIVGRLGVGAGMREHLAASVGVYRDYLGVLQRHGLLDLGADGSAARYALDATITGFLAVHCPWYESDHDLLPDAKATAMARTIRRAFEPVDAPEERVLSVAAREVTDLLERHTAALRQSLPCGCE